MENAFFETAKRLKEAGFPQPSPDFSQVWYRPWVPSTGEDAVADTVIVCGYMDLSDTVYFVWYGSPGIVKKMKANLFKDSHVYAPTATDIMRHLPDDTPLQYKSAGFRIGWRTSDNSAEAAADEYLALHEKEK